MLNPNKFSFINPSKSRIYYGYYIIILGTLGILASIPGQTVGVSTFTDPVKDALNLSRNQFSNAYMIGTILSSLLLAKAGKLYDKIGARYISFFATVILSFALLLSAASLNISNSISNFLNINSEWIAFSVMTILFFIIRFSGQGVLTMASRNMVMKWFDAHRGKANAIVSIAVSLGFSASPIWINNLIDNNGWQKSWIILAFILLIFSIIVILFFRDNPKKYGLLPDGKKITNKNNMQSFTQHNYTLAEAKKTRAFWMHSMILSFSSFFITGLTFHIVSIFHNSGYSKEQAVAIFMPSSIIAVTISFIANYLSDKIKLKLYLYMMISGGFLSSLGLIFLSSKMGIPLIIIGTGILSAFFAVLNSISWPRFFGNKHLGAISGKVMSFLVFSSALAPSFFSFSVTYLSSYIYIGFLSLAFLIFLTFASIKADNPVLKK